MNTNRGNNKRSGAPGNSNKSKPALPKRSQNPKKTKITPTDSAKRTSTKVSSNSVPKKPNQAPKRLKEKDEIRLNKFIANSGVCSRRDADIYIQSGNVKVNGVAVTEMGYIVKLTDVVNFDGVNLIPEKKEYFLLNKPKNFTTSEEEYNQSRNVFELMKGATKAKIAPVGRMDKNTTGLLVFTNDTDLIRKFSLPNQKSSKIYQVSLDKNLKFEDLEKITAGLTLDNHKITAEEVSYIENEPKSEVGIKLRSPNIKVVRSIFEHLHYNVIKIDRVVFAGLTKKNLPRGTWRALTEQEIINLKNY